MAQVTKKQRAFAEDIANYFGLELPRESTKEAYTRFIDRYAGAYKEAWREERAAYDAALESIDAKRDW